MRRSYTLTMLGFAAGNVLIGRYVDRLGIVIPIITAAVAMGLGFVGGGRERHQLFALLKACLSASERQRVSARLLPTFPTGSSNVVVSRSRCAPAVTISAVPSGHLSCRL